MTQQAIVVGDTARLTDAIRLMDDKRISVLPVVDSDEVVVGILSSSDVISMTHEVQSDLSALHHVNRKTREFLIQMLTDQGNNTLVMDVMTTPVESVSVRTNLIVASQKLAQRRFHHLPVIDDSGRPIGILATSDIVRAIAERGALAAG